MIFLVFLYNELMAKKKSSGIKKWFGDHTALSIVIAVVIVIVGFVGYNLFLDWRNRGDMRDLLASLEKLEHELENETGEQFYIEANCGTGGGFLDTRISCGLYLDSFNDADGAVYSGPTADSILDKVDCRVVTSSEATKYQALACNFNVRPLNDGFAGDLFAPYR